jgi:hypothetical protein
MQGDNSDMEGTQAGKEDPAELSNDELLGHCRAVCQDILRRRWIDERPLFVEVFRRVENHLIPNVRTKADACRLIGCSVRWAEMIVAGTARDSNKHKAKKTRKECEVSSGALAAISDEALISDILRYADRRLRLLMTEYWSRYRTVCELLENFFRGLSEAK